MSVVVDTYNHQSFIESALASVLDQDIGRKGVEVVVVDDGSTDGTSSIVEGFGRDVRLVRKKNGGQASAFNLGVSLTSAPIVAFLDGDDWWVPGKLTRVAGILNDEPMVGAVGHGLLETAGIADVRRVPKAPVTLHLRTREDIEPFLSHKSFLGASRFTARRSLVESILPIPEVLVVEADEYIFTLSAAAAPVRVDPAALTYYRLHERNLFQFRDRDPERRARKQQVLAALSRVLPASLRQRGVPDEVIEAVLLPSRVESERLRLALHGGARRDTLRVEHDAIAMGELLGVPKRRTVHAAAMTLAVALSPKTFYRVRDQYGRWIDRGSRRRASDR